MTSIIWNFRSFGLLWQKYLIWVIYKQQKFISHSSGDWVVQDQDNGRFSVWWGFASWYINGTFLLCPHMVERQGSSGTFYKNSNPIYEVTILITLITSQRSTFTSLITYNSLFIHLKNPSNRRGKQIQISDNKQKDI
jgi:hypothetical protein